MANLKKPFGTLGKHLKTVREQAKRSLAEVSGAVEISEGQLNLIEEGDRRPDEDVMLLLISYFNMADQEALHLWELAKYDSNLNEHIEIGDTPVEAQAINNLMSKPMVMLMAMEPKALYSDGIEVQWNEAGINMTFTQSTDKNQVTAVAKVGMSLKQAENVLKCLESAILHSKYNDKKLLPPSNS
jgi:transcriptional regulator with XRE-family HTH domain